MKKLLLVALLSLSVVSGFSTIISKDEQVKNMENGKLYLVKMFDSVDGKDLKAKFIFKSISSNQYKWMVNDKHDGEIKSYAFLKKYISAQKDCKIGKESVVHEHISIMEVTLSQPIEKFMSIQKEGFKIKPFKHCCCKCCCHKPVQPEQPAPAQE